jgi:UDP-2-acetamido-3-amino-2,3-dideoxy-glucuronate N-acetyltransferase
MEIKICITGVGNWGKNHLKTSLSFLPPENVFVFDSVKNSDDLVKLGVLPGNIIRSFDDLLKRSDINAVIVATPAETHYTVTKALLESGKNVLVEKPMSLNSSEAAELTAMAEERNLKLMVGHVLLYHPAIVMMKEEIKSGRIGKLQYMYSNRLNLGTLRTEENILWSFAPHDVSIFQYLTEQMPERVTARGAVFLTHNIEDTTFTYLEYPGNVHGHIFVSWLHPFKEQRLVVVGDHGMLVFDDTVKTEKLKFYKKGFRDNQGTYQKFDEDYTPVEFTEGQPLLLEQKSFTECIINNTQPLTDGRHGVMVLQILEMAQQKLKENG